ncbi:MAG: porin [Phycisphaerales bacterium]|jgi:hypothetical protein|nr:porin [Phycisphaerales bacterium]
MKTRVISSLVAAGLVVPALAEDFRDQEVAELRSMVEALKGEVDVLRAQGSDQWLNEQRSEQIRGIVQDVLADADTRASLQGSGATSGYNRGFFVQSADGNWKMKVNGQLQVRWNYNHAPDGDAAVGGGPVSDQYGFHVRRAKLKFSGNVIDPSWTYKTTLVSERNGGNGNTYLEDAWVNKKLDDGWYVKVGQFKAPYLREELVSSGAQLAVERSMINNQFTYGWAQGVELGSKSDDLWGRVWYGDGPNSLNAVGSVSSTAALTARVDYKLAGDWKDWKTLTGRGLKSDSYAFIGAAFEWFNMSEDRANSDVEYGGADATRSYGFTVDATFGGQGWIAYTYFAYANGKNAGGANPDEAEGWGWVAQGGFDVADNAQLFGRYELGDITNFSGLSGGGVAAVGNRNGHDSTLTMGLNYWPSGIKNVKLTADVGYAFSFLNDGGNVPSADYTSSGNGWRGDSNGSDGGQWLLRAQMQLLF